MEWYEHGSNLAALWRWLDARAEAPDDPAYYMANPWKWTPEWERMQAEKAERTNP